MSPDGSTSARPGGMKFIVLLRDPVDRLYSEFQMKHRRVQEQNAFLLLLERLGGDLQRCLVEYEEGHFANRTSSNSSSGAFFAKLSEDRRFFECLPFPLTRGRSFVFNRMLQQLEGLYSSNSSARAELADSQHATAEHDNVDDDDETARTTEDEPAGDDSRVSPGPADPAAPPDLYRYLELSVLPPSSFCFSDRPESPVEAGAVEASTAIHTPPEVSSTFVDADGTERELKHELELDLQLDVELDLEYHGDMKLRPPQKMYLQRSRCKLRY